MTIYSNQKSENYAAQVEILVTDVKNKAVTLDVLGVVTPEEIDAGAKKDMTSRSKLLEKQYDILILQNEYNVLAEQVKALQKADKAQQELTVGTELEHVRFGHGVSSSIDASGRMEVEFPGAVKKLSWKVCRENQLITLKAVSDNLSLQLKEINTRQLVLIYEIEKAGKELLKALYDNYKTRKASCKTVAEMKTIEKSYRYLIEAMGVYKASRSNLIPFEAALNLIAASEYILVRLLEAGCTKRALQKLEGKRLAARADRLRYRKAAPVQDPVKQIA